MTVTTLLVERDRYRLEDDVDVDALKDELVDAVRTGGDFVHVRALNQPDTVLLITPKMAVRLESMPRDEYSDWDGEAFVWTGVGFSDESALP
ncbi:hypothetical protein [Glaciibacter flavus]|uniref:hypothetical protein n=1 Tax=Orlajensenia flava TaxID=2565934 RepID=UPI003AFFB23F